MMQQLQIDEQMRDGILILSLCGQLDAMTADSLLSATKVIKQSPIKYLVLNFKEVSLVDSSGIGTMVSVLKQTRAKNGDTVVTNIGSQPMEVFKILNLDKAIRIFDSVDTAVAELGISSSSEDQHQPEASDDDGWNQPPHRRASRQKSQKIPPAL